MDNVLIVLGVLLGIVVIFGIYKLATRGTHDTSLYHTSSKAARRSGLKIFLLVVIAIAALFGLIYVLSNVI